MLSLLIDDEPVAIASEVVAGAAVSLVYRGSVEQESEVRAVVLQNSVLEENLVLRDGF